METAQNGDTETTRPHSWRSPLARWSRWRPSSWAVALPAAAREHGGAPPLPSGSLRTEAAPRTLAKRKSSKGCIKPGILARPARQYILSLAVLAAILGVFLLSWPQDAAADAKPELKFSSYSDELEEDSQRQLTIKIDPPLENESSALIAVLNESEVQEALAGDTRAADMGYTNVGYAERNVDYSVPVAVYLPAGAASVAFQLTILGDEIVEGEELFILKLVAYDGSPYTVVSDNSYNKTRVLVVDDEAPVLPGNLGVTLSPGAAQTGTGLSSKVTIKGDCPPAGGLKVHMKRADESWTGEGRTGTNVWPGSAAGNGDYSMNEIKECNGKTGEISVDGIASGEEWDLRAYVWQPDTPNSISVAAASEFSQVYRVVGWGVPSQADGLTLEPGVEQLGATWTPGVAVGTGITVTGHIRWRTQQVGLLGQPDYAAAGAWNAEDGVTADTSASHAITGLTGGKFYDVQVRSASPMGHSAWSLMASAPSFRAGAPSDDPPTGLAAAPGNASLVAGWKPPEDIDEARPDAYTVAYKTGAAPDRQAPVQDDPVTGWVSLRLTAGETSAEITGLTNGVSYDVRVRAQYPSGESSSGMAEGPWSATVSATPHEDAIWAAILTVSKELGVFFYGCGHTGPYVTRCHEALTDHDFEFEGVTYQWWEIQDGQPDEHLGNAVQPYPYPRTYLYPKIDADSPLRNGTMQFGSVTVSLGDAGMVHWPPGGNGFSLTSDDASRRHQGWAVGQRVPLSLQARAPVQTPESDTPPAPGGNIPEANLSVLTVSGGSNEVALTPAFASDITSYTASVDNSVSSVTMTPTVNAPNAEVTVDGSAVTSGAASPAISLTAGVARAIDIVVTAQDGTARTYTVTVTRALAKAPPVVSSDATLKDLTLSGGTNGVTITPAFASDTTAYTAGVGSSVGSVTVTPRVNDLNAAVTVDGSAVTSGTASPAISLTAGVAKAIDIVVTAQDGTANTYTVTVTRALAEALVLPLVSTDATLKDLTLSGGTNGVTITPAFASDTTAYTASVNDSVGSVTVTPTVSDPNASVTVDGSTVASGAASSAIALTEGTPRAIDIVVTAQDGTANTYTVTVTRARAKTLPVVSSDSSLKALTVSDGTNGVTITPAFALYTAAYTASVGNSVGSVTVTPTVNDSNASVTVAGSAVASGAASSAISLAAGVPKAIDIVVTAQDGATRTYTVTVTREKSSDATLKALTLSDGTNGVPITPAFASDTIGYTATVGNSVGSVTVTPTVNDPGAAVTVAGSSVTSGAASSAISLAAGVAEAVDIVVTPQDGPANTYTVTVTREKSSDATLSALTVSDGTNGVPLTPAFASDTIGYTATVGNSVGSVTVTPTVNDPNAAVTVDGSEVASGAASSAIALTEGDSRAISVEVTAQDGTANTYTVTVTRENGDSDQSGETQRDANDQIFERCWERNQEREGLMVCVYPFEGGNGILLLTLPNPAPAGGTTIALATDPNQTASSDDYTMPDAITIEEGKRGGLIIVEITADSEAEGDESIYIFACIKPAGPDDCDPSTEWDYNHGIVIPGDSGGL